MALAGGREGLGAQGVRHGGGHGGVHGLVVRAPDDQRGALPGSGSVSLHVGVLVQIVEPGLAQLLHLAVDGGEHREAIGFRRGAQGLVAFLAAEEVLQVGGIRSGGQQRDGVGSGALSQQLQGDAAAHAVAEQADLGDVQVGLGVVHSGQHVSLHVAQRIVLEALGALAAAGEVHADGTDALGSQRVGNGREAHVLLAVAAVAMGQYHHGEGVHAVGGDEGGGHLHAAGFVGEGGGFGGGGSQGQGHDQGQRQGKQLLHGESSLHWYSV